MIRELLHAYGSTRQKLWDYDRKSWVGSSEVGKCLRQVAFSKWEDSEPDPEFVETWGARLRGTVMEEQLFVPALRASLPEGARLLYAGNEQETLVDGYLSATTDGVLVGMPRDCLADRRVEDTGLGGIVVECKSLDPRYTGKLPKPEHADQVQAAMGVIRRAYYPEHPEYAVISYIDASFWDRCQEFVVRFDQRKYDALKERAMAVMAAEAPCELPPEGKLSGGGECRYCPYQRQCGDGSLASMPGDNGVRLPGHAVAELKGLRDAERKLAGSIDDNSAMRAMAQEAIKQLLRQYGARGHKETDGSWSVAWSTVKGRTTVDFKALEATGLDLKPYRKEGSPSERLTIT